MKTEIFPWIRDIYRLDEFCVSSCCHVFDWNIFLVARMHAGRIQSQALPNDSVGSKRDINIVAFKGQKTLTVIMGTHFFCLCPLFVFFLVYTYCPSCQGKSMDAINYVIFFLRYCNSLANPLIYSGYTGNFALISSDACSDEMKILKKCKLRLLLKERKKEIKRTDYWTNNELLLSGKRGNARVMHITHIQFLFWSWQSKNNKRTFHSILNWKTNIKVKRTVLLVFFSCFVVCGFFWGGGGGAFKTTNKFIPRTLSRSQIRSDRG